MYFSRSPPAAEQLALEFGGGLGMKHAEGQVLEFLLQPMHAQAVGQGHIDIDRLLSDPLLRIFFEIVERPHVVQPVG